MKGIPMTGRINLTEPKVLLVMIESYPRSRNNMKKSPEEMTHVSLNRYITGGQRKLIQE